MRWITLYKRLGKQPLARTQHENVYALLQNPETGNEERVFLELAFDCTGRPYLRFDGKAQEAYEKEKEKGKE